MTGGNPTPRIVILQTEWMDSAACRGADPNLFYRSEKTDTIVSKRVIETYCNHCVVKFECLAAAFDNDEHSGIWGGTTPTMRLRIKKAEIFEKLEKNLEEFFDGRESD